MRCLSNCERQAVVTEALKWIGVPYRLNGKTKDGVDCSQLVLAVYKNALGIKLISKTNGPFLASWLFASLAVITTENLLSGDLVFYSREPQPKGRLVTSVAIYIGAGQVVHASLRLRRVAVESIFDYPGFLLTGKDFEAVEKWLSEHAKSYAKA